MSSRYLELAREALEDTPTPTRPAVAPCAESAKSAESAAPWAERLPAGYDAAPAPICLTCRRRPTTPRTGYRCPECVARAYAFCDAWRPGDGPIILTGDGEP